MIQTNNKLNEKDLNNIFRDYKLKIESKTQFEEIYIASDDINNLIILLNWCFIHKNNFFVENFNKKSVFSVCLAYNIFKTNILSDNNYTRLFDKIELPQLKMFKFILHNYINNYTIIQSDEYNTRLCETVTKNSMNNCIQYLNGYIK